MFCHEKLYFFLGIVKNQRSLIEHGKVKGKIRNYIIAEYLSLGMGHAGIVFDMRRAACAKIIHKYNQYLLFGYYRGFLNRL